MKDWLVAYNTPTGIDLPRLLHDDHFVAIKLLFNSRRYVSCAKLMVSFIDTLGYLAFGEKPRSFQSWLERFADLSSVGVTPDELWEYRNALLHMTNSESRKVAAGKVRELTLYVAGKTPVELPELGSLKAFDLYALMRSIGEATSSMIQHLNDNPDASLVFLERYDRVLSDARYQFFEKGDDGAWSPTEPPEPAA